MTVRQALKLHPDVIIMDLMMPKKDGVAANRTEAVAIAIRKRLVQT